MTTEEIKKLIKQVHNFENNISKRADALLQASNSDGIFDRVKWDDSDENVIYIRVSDRWDTWGASFPVEYFADDFDVNAYEKKCEEEKKQREKEQKARMEETQLRQDRADYERLRKKFENI